MKQSITSLLTRWLNLCAILLLFLCGLEVSAQNVTIGPDNGNLISGFAGGNTGDSGLGRRMASMWRHEQLPLMMTTSDIANLTSAGELADPSCALDVYNDHLIIGAGQTQTFMVVSLPKGYRITQYKLVLQPNISGTITLHQGATAWNIGQDDRMSFYETPGWSSGSPYGNNTHSTQLNCPDALATATAADGSTVMENNNNTNRNKEFTIERKSLTETDMTNQLHFFFARATSQYAVTIKSFEIWFTAEGTFETEVTPVASSHPVSATTSPFPTSKMDVGAIQWVDKTLTINNQQTRVQLYAYDYTNVRDLIAYMSIYQEDAVSGGKPSDVATNKHIYPLEVDGKGAYAYEEDTYYIEPPVSIHTASGWEAPIGFRIVGAKFNCRWGTETPEQTKHLANACRIYRGNNANQNNLNANLDFSGSFTWQLDEYGNIYTETGDANNTYRRYLACYGSGDSRIVSLSSAATGTEATWNLRIAEAGNAYGIPAGRVYYRSDGGNNYILNYVEIQEGGDTHYRGYVTRDYTGNNYANSSETGNQEIYVPGYKPGQFTLNIYDKTGTTFESHVITEAVGKANNGQGTTFELKNLNNDAVKFSITDLAEGCKALVNVTLELEALNPYINKMDVVCEGSKTDENTGKTETLKLVQTFTASDFSVSGGAFIFYIPDDWADTNLNFSFQDLYSNYGDETYYAGTDLQQDGNARYSFVTSPYFSAFDDVDGNKIAPTHPEEELSWNNDATDAGLYDQRYKTYGPEIPSTHKVYAGVSGNIRFKFNNAEDLTTGDASSTAKSLEEYPFSVETYLGSANPDAANGLPAGEFSQIVMNATVPEQKTGTYYVFTGDETRYNIAPTTSWQHRYFAFYRMDITLIAKSYTPALEWTKIYDPSCFTDNEDNVLNTAMWGLKVTAKDKTDAGVYVDPIDGGYLSADEIRDAIYGKEDFEKIGASIGQEGAPSYLDQILYVDASKLSNVVVSTDYDLSMLQSELAKNALIYLPVNTTSTLDNFAYQTKSGSFMAGRNVVLTDKVPFYAPYAIDVDAANSVTYKREVTVQKYGKATNATIIMPFQMLVDNGVHTNADGSKFSLHNIKANQTFGFEIEDETYIAYAPTIEGVTVTKPNTPYIVKVADGSASTEENISFVANQKGATIAATTDMRDDYTFAGDVVSAVSDGLGNTYYFHPYGSYSGKELKKSDGHYYYFAKNMFWCSDQLTKSTVKMLPFRAYFVANNISNPTKYLDGFDISFEEGIGGEATAISNVSGTNPDLIIQTGKGYMTITSAIDQPVQIHNVSGVNVNNVKMQAGDTRTVAVPSGIYIVNGAKLIVR